MTVNFCMNKKAQIGKLISLFPIMLLIFIIMGIFVLLSSAYSFTKNSDPNKIESIASVPKGNFLERNVNSDEGLESVREALIKFGDSYKFGDRDNPPNSEGFDILKNELSVILTQDRVGNAWKGTCLIVYGQVSQDSYSRKQQSLSIAGVEPLITMDYANGIFVIFIVKTNLGPRYDDKGMEYASYRDKLSPRVELPNKNFYPYEIYYYYDECSPESSGK